MYSVPDRDPLTERRRLARLRRSNGHARVEVSLETDNAFGGEVSGQEQLAVKRVYIGWQSALRHDEGPNLDATRAHTC
jgi:hypothetical protein